MFLFRSGGSESLYERLPLGGEVSPGDDLEDPGTPYSEDSDVDGGIGTARMTSSPSRENGAGEHLVKPSQIKNRRSRAQGEPLPACSFSLSGCHSNLITLAMGYLFLYYLRITLVSVHIFLIELVF